MLIFSFKDTADGEFSVVKTAIARYLVRSSEADEDYIEIKNSETVIKFLTKHLSKPSSRSGINERIFMNIHPDVFLQRNEEAPETVKSLAGISTKFQYVVEVNLYLRLNTVI